MSFATDMQEIAVDLLTEFGQIVTFSRTTQGTFIPNSGAVASGTASTYTALINPSDYTSEEIDGISVLYGDVKLLCYTTTPVLVGDTVDLDGVTYRVMSVIKIRAQGVTIVYKVQVRV